MFWEKTSKIKTFSPKYTYEITKLESLGKGFINEGVYRFKIDYYLTSRKCFIKKSKENRGTIYLAGKIFVNNLKFNDSVNAFIQLRKKKIINYSVRQFDLKKTDIKINNCSLSEIEKCIFLTDFTLGEFIVEPINIIGLPNHYLDKLNLTQKTNIFREIFDSLLILYENSIYVKIVDIWMIIKKDNNIRIEVVDLDNLTNVKESDFPDSFELFFNSLDQNFISELKNILANDKYDNIRNYYFYFWE